MAVAIDLSGQVAIVTGGGTGLGQATSLGLARAGAAVVLASKDEEPLLATKRLIEAEGGRAEAILTDVSDEASAQAMAKEAERRLGRIDILVNNAAIYPSKPWTEVSREEWDEVFAVNARGAFLCARAVYPSMLRQGRGRIINIGSITYFLGFPDLIHYVATKGASIGFTRALAREVGPHNITVNNVSPGAFPTAAEEIHPDREGYNRHILEQQSLKRRGHPDDVASAVLFFASDLASFITGQTLQVNGGWAMD